METWKLMAITLLVVGIIGVTATYALIATVGTQDMFSVTFYDKNKNPIGRGLSIVDGESGVFYVKLHTTVKNTGELPLGVYINWAEPKELRDAYSDVVDSPATELSPGESTKWDSDFVDITKFEGQTVTFSVEVNGEYTYGGQTETITKTAEIELDVQPDPQAGMDVDIDYSSKDDSGGGGNTDTPSCWSAGTDCDPNDNNCCNTCEGSTAERKVTIFDQTGNQCCPLEDTVCSSEYEYCLFYEKTTGEDTTPKRLDPGAHTWRSCTGLTGSYDHCELVGIKTENTYQCT